MLKWQCYHEYSQQYACETNTVLIRPPFSQVTSLQYSLQAYQVCVMYELTSQS